MSGRAHRFHREDLISTQIAEQKVAEAGLEPAHRSRETDAHGTIGA
jgi:hypothetical protein